MKLSIILHVLHFLKGAIYASLVVNLIRNPFPGNTHQMVTLSLHYIINQLPRMYSSVPV